MKSILIIGMGRFGKHLCTNLARLGNQIMAVDENEETLEDMLEYVVSAKIGDCTNEAVLRSLGIDNFDICFICIGNNFQSSLEITSMVKELGGRYVVSKANRDIHAKFLLRNGADEVIYPDRDIAEKMAVRYSANHVFDYIELTEEFSIYEIPPLPEWVGKSIIELSIRNKYRISILATKEGERAKLMPTADYVIRADEHLMVIGKNEDVDKILKELKPKVSALASNYADGIFVSPLLFIILRHALVFHPALAVQLLAGWSTRYYFNFRSRYAHSRYIKKPQAKNRIRRTLKGTGLS